MSEDVTANLAEVNERIRAAAGRAGRDADDVKLIAVSKTHPAEVLREAIASGAAVFGENKVQEAEGKIAVVGRDAAEWHLIGHLQSNKARKAVQLFDVIQSLDSVELAERLERICIEEGRGELSVLAQVDLAGEETKSGIDEADLSVLVEFLKGCERLRFKGLMILPPFFDDPEATRPYFVRLREIRDRLSGQGVFNGGRGELSMGMSHDFEVAVEEGATMVRVGTAIFGVRAEGYTNNDNRLFIDNSLPDRLDDLVGSVFCVSRVFDRPAYLQLFGPESVWKDRAVRVLDAQADRAFCLSGGAPLAQFRVDIRLAPLVTMFIGLVLTYFASSIIGNTLFVIDGLTAGVVGGNPKVFVGFVLYGLLSVLILFIFIRFISSWFVFTRNTFLGFVKKLTDPIMIPVQKLIPPIGMFDISAMIVLLLIGFLQSLVLNIFVRP